MAKIEEYPLLIVALFLVGLPSCRTVQKGDLKATEYSAAAGPMREQYAEGHLFKSLTFLVEKVDGGRRYSLTNFSLDLEDATVRYENFLIASRNGEVVGMLHYEGKAPDAVERNEQSVSYIDVEKQTVSADSPVANAAADSFRKVLDLLQKFDDPRGKAFSAEISRLAFNPQSVAYRAAQTPDHLSSLLTSPHPDNLPSFYEIFDRFAKKQTYRAKLPGGYNLSFYELQISRNVRRESAVSSWQEVNLVLTKRMGLLPVETSTVTIALFRKGSRTYGEGQISYSGPLASNLPPQFIGTPSGNYTGRIKLLSLALGMLDTANVGAAEPIRVFLDRHLHAAEVGTYETTVEKLVAGRVHDLLSEDPKAEESRTESETEERNRTAEADSSATTDTESRESSSDVRGSSDPGTVRAAPRIR